MKTFNPSDSLHKSWMFKILSEIAEDTTLVNLLAFKGGTCAAMLGYLERFSVDLDFDLIDPDKLSVVKKKLEAVFTNLGLKIKDQSQKTAQYFLKYPNQYGLRNTIKLDCVFPIFRTNTYEKKNFSEIQRILNCQTIETMFANKLVALIDRYQKTGAIAGRDLYDISVFFQKGTPINEELIFERTGWKLKVFLSKLKVFIEKNITQSIIDEDLNTLLPAGEFKKIRKHLKVEVLAFL